MPKRISYLLFSLAGVILTLSGMGQTPDTAGEKIPEMADAMRSNGKIYVVIAVIATILLGLILYVARLDRKISRLEKEGQRN